MSLIKETETYINKVFKKSAHFSIQIQENEIRYHKKVIFVGIIKYISYSSNWVYGTIVKQEPQHHQLPKR